MDFKRRSDIHYARKLWHVLGVFVMFLAYVLLPWSVSYGILLTSWIAFGAFDVLRQSRPALNEWALHAFKAILRENEVQRLAGTTHLLTGVLIITSLFPRPVVALTLLFLAFADPFASLVGIKYGKDKIFGHKSIQGFMAAFVVCFLLCLIFLRYNAYLVDRLLVVSLFAGLIGAFSELVPIGKLDDNLTLPVLSAVGLYILFYFFGFFANVG